MATIDVKDAANQTVAIEKPLAPGRAAAAASRPVVLSTDDLASLAAIVAAIEALPAGGDASAANQATIISALGSLIGHVDGVEALLTAISGKDFATQTTLAALLAKVIAAPATEAKQDAALAATNLIGTRAYGSVERVSVGSAATQSAAITATEVLLHASVKCYVLAGSGTPAPTSSSGIPLEAGEKFHMRITSGHKVGVIRDSADGFLHIAPVV